MPANPKDRTDFGSPPAAHRCLCGHDQVALVKGKTPIPHTRPDQCIDYLRGVVANLALSVRDLENLTVSLRRL